MSLADDLRAMIGSASELTGKPTTVTLKNGQSVEGLPGVATVNDTVLGTSGEINGTEQTLRFTAEDVPGLKANDPLTWNSKSWKVKHVQILAGGALVKAFLQEAL